MVADELRAGNQQSENGTVTFPFRCVAILLAVVGFKAEELLVRVDSGHDASDFIQALQELGVKYIVKRNQQSEASEQLLHDIQGFAVPWQPRPGKTVYHGIRGDRTPKDFPGYKGFMPVEGTVRTILSNGQMLLEPKVEVDSWWTNLPTSVSQCVKLYHDHATSEQFHSKLKSDMGLEFLPSDRLVTNSLILGLSTIAFNCLWRHRAGCLGVRATVRGRGQALGASSPPHRPAQLHQEQLQNRPPCRPENPEILEVMWQFLHLKKIYEMG